MGGTRCAAGRLTARAGSAQERRREELAELQALIHQLEPLDRQIVLLYLEGESAAEIADVTGLTAGSVATRIHRIKKDPSSVWYRYLASGWPTVATWVLLVVVWLAFSSAAKKATREFEALRQRIASA